MRKRACWQTHACQVTAPGTEQRQERAVARRTMAGGPRGAEKPRIVQVLGFRARCVGCWSSCCAALCPAAGHPHPATLPSTPCQLGGAGPAPCQACSCSRRAPGAWAPSHQGGWLPEPQSLAAKPGMHVCLTPFHHPRASLTLAGLPLGHVRCCGGLSRRAPLRQNAEQLCKGAAVGATARPVAQDRHVICRGV